MRPAAVLNSTLLVVVGAATGAAVVRWTPSPEAAAAPSQQPSTNEGPDALRTDVTHLKDVTPSQSHAMADVGYHFANLWFAGQQKNWDLARYYYDEARSHILWTIRIQPIRKDAAGNAIDLKGLFDGLENGVFNQVVDAISRKDSTQFTTAYKLGLQGCYSCHRASGKAYLRPMVPTSPPQPIINFDPRAQWP